MRSTVVGSRRLGLLAFALATLTFATAPTASAGTTDFPAGYEGYHTYAEMLGEIDAAVSAHPGIVDRFSIGQSYEAREIWAVKISDNVDVDEDEPEVLFEGLHHASEHMSLEMNLYLLSMLTANYGESDALGERVTDIVDGREIYIVFMLNPDGAEWDISAGGSALRNWRRNRQPIPNAAPVGVDLNRNWGFGWGCCKGSTAMPGRWNYRGPEPWFAPEVRALRDFVLSRVVNGRQQIRAAMSFHISGQQIMWPYGNTFADLPKTLTANDLQAFVALGHGIAALNGYVPQQMSDLYLSDGSATDWLYGDQRILALIMEMSATEDPKGNEIAAELALNHEAMLYFLENADCPYRPAGLDTINCGPLYDDFEIGRGWTVNPHGTDTATAGTWQRGIGQKTKTSAGIKQRAVVPSGQAAFFTGTLAGATAAANDVDGGTTTIRSPLMELDGGASDGWTLSFSYVFAHNSKAKAVDYLRVSVEGQAVPLFVQSGFAGNRNAAWTAVSVDLDAFAGQTIRLLIEVQRCRGGQPHRSRHRRRPRLPAALGTSARYPSADD